MRKFRTFAVVTALAAVALLVPSTAQAATVDKTGLQSVFAWRP